MTDSNPAERPWTPAPWSVRDGTPEGGGQVWEITSPHAPDVNCNEVASSWESKPTADLIALAPSMAEAILDYVHLWKRVNPDHNPTAGGAMTDLLRVANKLRAIGSEGVTTDAG